MIDELEALKEKQIILLGLKQACKEIKKQRKGNLKEQTLEDFLDELKIIPTDHFKQQVRERVPGRATNRARLPLPQHHFKS